MPIQFGAGTTVGRPEFEAFKISRSLSASSPTFVQRLFDGRSFSSVTIDAGLSGGSTSVRYALGTTFVTKWGVSGRLGQPLEKIELTAARVTTVPSVNGVVQGSACWDVAQARAC